MPIPSAFLLMLTIYITVNSQFLPSNEVQVQKAPELISTDYGEENRELAYNKGALLVRRKRVAALIVKALTTLGTAYICRVLATATPFDNALKRWALKYWGFRDGREAGRWKELAKFVHKNVLLDADGNIVEIRDFIDAPKGMENAPVLLSKIKNSTDLGQITKAMMADNMIDTLIGINGEGVTTWKVNPNKQEHRKLYEALLRIKEAIDRKYKDQCKLKRITAKELPEFKAWYERLLGGVPEWFSNVFSGVKAAKHEPVKMSAELDKKIREIQAMAEEVLEAAEKAEKAREKNRDTMKLAAELPEPFKSVEVDKGYGRKEDMQQPGLKVKLKKE
ncbi:hypothetical protein DdX_19111 [Ditylenchus destructor]|uniref:Uncharacterized protein n=1 Tax=Ditylenchus destructor TaxID=166010 RepID=A0AAD4MN82_9BILA|nr:hypothetical protein DdX_19111 [Ditylenchus destructor]